MSFLHIKVIKNHCIEIKMPKILTFASINKIQPFRQLNSTKKNKISEVIINCKEVEEIDSCGLAMITSIQKAYPKAKSKILTESKKIEKLSKLYLTTKDTYEDRSK
ncbi:MAG: STAS domain-containing protein [Pseudomonadota bacterium]|nr:STAS domain-containing protein [Pseudomonadota bacterium]